MPNTAVLNSCEFRDPVTFGDACLRLSRIFRKAGIETAALDARLLMAEAAGLSPEEVISRRDMILSPASVPQIGRFAARRLAGEPVSRIIGRREFWGLPFNLSPHTLDPRPDTELLVEAVLDYARTEGLHKAPLRVLDLGTGSGCVLGAILTELPFSFGVGLDRSAAALQTARENLCRLGLLDRSAFLCANWLDPLGENEFDIVIGNPPYIASGEIHALSVEVRNYEPRLALDGGFDGLQAYGSIMARIFRTLRMKAFVAVETGRGQAETVQNMMAEAAGDESVFQSRILADLSGVARVVAGVRQSPGSALNCKKKIGNPVLSL